MQRKSIRGGQVEVEATNKALTGWGGLTLFSEFISSIGLRDELERILPNKKESPNQISGIDTVLALLATVLMGGDRFAHVERVRADEVVHAIIGAGRLPSADSTRRYFASLTKSECEAVYEALQKFIGGLLIRRHSEDVLDLDSTTLERYGSQEGVGKGYHKSRAGQLSHHPLLGMLAASKTIVHSWLRQGGASTMRGTAEFMKELMARLPKDLKIALVRADSGFHAEPFIETLEDHSLDYIVAIRMREPMKKEIRRIPEHEWKPLNDTHQIADIRIKQANWKAERRVLMIRRPLRENGTLFKTVDYEYNALLTSLTLDAVECSRLYDRRGECENTIKEFKNDFGARGFCMRSFDGTEMVLRLISVLFNVVSEFKHVVLRNTSVTLATIRTKIFVVGAMLGRRGRIVVLRVGLIKRWIEKFETLLDRSLTASPPTAAQPLSPGLTPSV